MKSALSKEFAEEAVIPAGTLALQAGGSFLSWLTLSV
jgi:hypothetical protein